MKSSHTASAPLHQSCSTIACNGVQAVKVFIYLFIILFCRTTVEAAAMERRKVLWFYVP